MIPGIVAQATAGASTPALTPPMTDLIAWFDASDIATLTLRDEEFVSQWADKSGNNYHLVQATDANQPSLVNGSRPYVNMPGSPRRMTAPLPNMTQPVSIVAVCSTGVAAGGLMFDATSSSNRIAFGALSGTSSDFALWAGNASAPAWGSQPAELGVYVGLVNGASSAVRLNGTQVGSGTSGSNSMQGLTLGCRYSNERFLPSKVYELLFYDRLLSAAELAEVEEYARTKWGLPLFPPPVSAQYVFVQDLTNNRELYAKNSNTVTSVNAGASLAKLATALILLDRKAAVLDSETVSVEAGDLTTSGTNAGLTAGDVLTWRNLLHGLLIPSGNDAADCIARVIGTEMFNETGTGTTGKTRFVEAMNALAAALDMSGTTFGTPSGVGGNNYYTARDLGKLGKEFFGKALLRSISAVPSYNMTITGPNARSQAIRHTSAVISGPFWDQTQGVKDTRVLGSKTGSYIGGGVDSYSVNALWTAPNGTQVLVTVLRSATSYSRYLDLRAIFNTLVKDYPYLAVSTASETDPSIADVALLIGAESGITDESPLGQALTVTGATADNTNPLIESYSVKTDGVDDRIAVADGANVTVGSDDWTLEFWYRGTGAEPSTASALSAFAGKYSRSGNQREFALVWAQAANRFETYASPDGSAFSQSNNALASDAEANVFFNGSPRHICIQRSGTEIATFIDGEKLANTLTFAGAIFDGTAPFMIGARASGASYEDPVAGMFDEIRFTKGVARYPTAMFTPETKPYPRS